jgi:TatD DNase family protein
LDRIYGFVRGLVDSHCHLDAAEFDLDRDAVIASAQQAGVSAILIPSVARENFKAVVELCQRQPCCAPALGIHPMYVDRAVPDDLRALEQAIDLYQPVAVGEIGLDYFVEGYDVEQQAFYYVEQLKLARKFGLPVLLHVRKSLDDILKHLRRIRVCGGIAHAFNGSFQQAQILIDLGFKLGFGGAMTWPRATHLRELARTLPLEAIVLETDAPDIPPEWLGRAGRNTPDQLVKIAETLAELRAEKVTKIVDMTTQNVFDIVPKMHHLYT